MSYGNASGSITAKDAETRRPNSRSTRIYNSMSHGRTVRVIRTEALFLSFARTEARAMLGATLRSSAFADHFRDAWAVLEVPPSLLLPAVESQEPQVFS